MKLNELNNFTTHWTVRQDLLDSSTISETFFTTIKDVQYGLQMVKVPRWKVNEVVPGYLFMNTYPKDRGVIISFGNIDEVSGESNNDLTNKGDQFLVLGAITTKIFEYLNEKAHMFRFIGFCCKIESKRPVLYEKLAQRIATKYKGELTIGNLADKRYFTIELKREE